jgi:hypothetical protein
VGFASSAMRAPLRGARLMGDGACWSRADAVGEGGKKIEGKEGLVGTEKVIGGVTGLMRGREFTFGILKWNPIHWFHVKMLDTISKCIGKKVNSYAVDFFCPMSPQIFLDRPLLSPSGPKHMLPVDWGTQNAQTTACPI